MPWVNMDDRFPDHPKNASLSDAAFRLQVAGICYCHRNSTDGLIDLAEVPRLVRRFKKNAVSELVNKGLWYFHEAINAYELHDYLDWNDSRDVIQARSEKQRKNARRRWDG